jgi:hypothetical protein
LQILDIRTPEDDIVIHFVASRNLGSILLSALCSERSHVLERNVGVFSVDGVQNALVANLTFGREADEAADVGVGRIGAAPTPHGTLPYPTLAFRSGTVTLSASALCVRNHPRLDSSPGGHEQDM